MNDSRKVPPKCEVRRELDANNEWAAGEFKRFTQRCKEARRIGYKGIVK